MATDAQTQLHGAQEGADIASITPDHRGVLSAQCKKRNSEEWLMKEKYTPPLSRCAGSSAKSHEPDAAFADASCHWRSTLLQAFRFAQWIVRPAKCWLASTYMFVYVQA